MEHRLFNRNAFCGGRFEGMLSAGPGRVLTLVFHEGQYIDTYFDVFRKDYPQSIEDIFDKYNLDPTRFYELMVHADPTIHTVLIDVEIYRKADEK